MSDGMWTHAICIDCWHERAIEMAEPVRTPVRIPHTREVCCFCGLLTTDGIYVRTNGITLQCKGHHTTVEPSAGIHIITINGPGIMTTDYETNRPVGMFIATLANGDTVFLTLETPALEAIGTDIITVESMMKTLIRKHGTPADAAAISHTLTRQAFPSLSATEARARLEHQIAQSRMVADARRAEPGDEEPSATGTGDAGQAGADGYAQ